MYFDSVPVHHAPSLRSSSALNSVRDSLSLSRGVLLKEGTRSDIFVSISEPCDFELFNEEEAEGEEENLSTNVSVHSKIVIEIPSPVLDIDFSY
jgi:hypothetical protein